MIPNTFIDGAVAGVSVDVWNAKRRFLERGHADRSGEDLPQ